MYLQKLSPSPKSSTRGQCSVDPFIHSHKTYPLGPYSLSVINNGDSDSHACWKRKLEIVLEVTTRDLCVPVCRLGTKCPEELSYSGLPLMGHLRIMTVED